MRLEPAEVERQLGPAGPTTLQAEEVAALADRLDELMADAEAVTDDGKPSPTWNGRDFYVTIGDRSWEDAERYGFISAGGGEIWTKPLERLFPGARVFLYKPYPVKGYVGVGIVKETARPVTEFEVEVDGADECRSSRRRSPSRRRSATTPTTPSFASTSSASSG